MLKSEEEKQKLFKIRDILKKYPEHSLYIGGDFGFEEDSNLKFGLNPNETIYMMDMNGKVYSDGELHHEIVGSKEEPPKHKRAISLWRISDASWNVIINYPHKGIISVHTEERSLILDLRKDVKKGRG